MTKRYRWSCEGGHPGVLAPGRLRKVDIRRYCWECSKAAGVLVERTCGVLEAKRAAKAERRVAKRAKASEKRKAAAAVYPGIIHELFRKWKRLRAWDCPDRIKRAKLRSMRRRRAGEESTGTCWGGGIPSITLTVGTDAADGYATLLHELAHAGCVVGESHGSAWRTTFLEAAEEVTGEKLTPCFVSSCHDVHRAVRTAFERMIERGDLPGRV